MASTAPGIRCHSAWTADGIAGYLREVAFRIGPAWLASWDVSRRMSR